LRMVGTKRRVLEIGCSSGSQTRSLSGDLECQVVAVEIDPVAAERARPYCERLIVGSIESLSTEDLSSGGAYDVVLFADVLEHLRDPRAALEKVRALISPNGCVLASIPNVTHSALVFEMMNGRFEYRDYGLLDATHIRFFDRVGVLRLFEEAGYVVEDTDCVTVPPDQTEFRVQPADDDDRFVLNYMRRRNPDSETFQFIVRAVPGIAGIDSKGAALAARRRIETLEREVVEMRKVIAMKEAENVWLSRGAWNRTIHFVRNLFSRG